MRQMLLFLLIVSLVGCQKKDVSPSLPANDLLYKTWRLVQVLHDGQATDYTRNNFTVTFPRDGSFVGNQPKTRITGCCAPVAFEGTSETIRFIWDTSSPDCALVLCALSPLTGGVTWQITTLTDNSLVLTSGNTVLVFKA